MPKVVPLTREDSYKTIQKILTERALRCLECGAPQSSLAVMSDERAVRTRYFIACKECRHMGPYGKNIPHAVEQWNKPLGFFAALVLRWQRKRIKWKMQEAARKAAQDKLATA